jgi:excisionase family DNA binding protein
MEVRLYIDETADYLGVDRTTLYRWIRDGRIHPHRQPGGRPYFLRSELDDLLDPDGHVTRPLLQVYDLAHGVAQRLRRLDADLFPAACEHARMLEGLAERVKPLIGEYAGAQEPSRLGRPHKL